MFLQKYKKLVSRIDALEKFLKEKLPNLETLFMDKTVKIETSLINIYKVHVNMVNMLEEIWKNIEQINEVFTKALVLAEMNQSKFFGDTNNIN